MAFGFGGDSATFGDFEKNDLKKRKVEDDHNVYFWFFGQQIALQLADKWNFIFTRLSFEPSQDEKNVFKRN